MLKPAEISNQNNQFSSTFHSSNETPNKSKHAPLNNNTSTSHSTKSSASRYVTPTATWIKQESNEFAENTNHANKDENEGDDEEASDDEEEEDDDDEEEEDEASLQPTSIFEYEQPSKSSPSNQQQSKTFTSRFNQFNAALDTTSYQYQQSQQQQQQQQLQQQHTQPQAEQYHQNNNTEHPQTKKKRGRKPKRGQIEKLKIVINNYTPQTNNSIELSTHHNGLNTIVTSKAKAANSKKKAKPVEANDQTWVVEDLILIRTIN